MGAKRSSIAWMLEAGAWMLAGSGCGGSGVAGLRPGAFRFTPRLSHARIPGHGLQALSRAGTVPGGAPRLARGQSPGDWGKIRAGLKTREAQAEFLIGWQRKLHGAGYVGLHWPTAYGGRSATVLEQAIFYEEMARARAPELPNAIGLDMAGPAIIAHASDRQKQAHLSKILSADHIFCQGFSEPNAGSDLASVETRAERKNGDYVINGQKVWTSYATPRTGASC